MGGAGSTRSIPARRPLKHRRGRDSHLARVGRETAHEGVTVGAGGGALVIVLDDDSLLARIAAIGDYNNFTACIKRKIRRRRRRRGPSR